MFSEYWKKIIDQEENQTELASMDAVSCFASAKLDRIYIKDDSNEDLLQAAQNMNASRVSRDSMVMDTESAESDLTVLPEEVCVVSIGSEDSETTRLRREKALRRRRDL